MANGTVDFVAKFTPDGQSLGDSRHYDNGFDNVTTAAFLGMNSSHNSNFIDGGSISVSGGDIHLEVNEIFPGFGDKVLTVSDDNLGVGIGTTTPDLASKLDVIGAVKITDGTQGTGKVLTSDAAGLASWQTLPTIAGPTGPQGATGADGARTNRPQVCNWCYRFVS
ncbi:MAG: hypothetical protein IPH78_15190 [Bacteroidetes bacterium]|nr:hypothetical protein [Bacteroidota bacterium]